MKQVLLYLPVIHAGYEAFLRKHSDAAGILLLGHGFTADYPSLAKDIRALPAARAASYLRLVSGDASIRVVEPADLAGAVTGDPLVLPDEAVMRDIADRYRLGAGRSLVFDRTFLRWDRDWATAKAPVGFDGEITAAELPRELLGRAQALAGRSSDWWRQVGAVAARADLSTAIHAEASLIAGAARDGISLAGADLYTTTFPCPACARLIAEAGFVRWFFADQYSVLDGEQTLRARGISLIWVDTRAGS